MFRLARSHLAALPLALLLLAARLTAAPQFADDSELINRVVDLLDRRLAIMPEVAAIKYQQQKPIADPPREQVVIDNSVADARALHLDDEAARAFFSVQITMARAVQEQLFARWQADRTQPPHARDLVKYLRPDLDELGRKLLPAVYLASPALVDLSETAATARLARLQRHGGITATHLADLARALTALRLTAAPDWAVLQRAGVLRVGTTGDYAPFSDDSPGTLRGVDIDLTQSLAQSWGLSVVFVRTTWSTLMSDLAKHRFDLAASGVSVTPERSRVADFSAPYYFDGKTPIARREQATRFSSLEQIDLPGVRIVVNPGGTNERFVRENIRRATITVHPDNRTIFAEIVAGRADLMITDGIEVRLQTARHPELQGTRPEPFTRTGKAFLLSPKTDLIARLDAWLTPQIEGGDIATKLTQAIETATATKSR